MKTVLLRFRFTVYALIISTITLTIVALKGDKDFSTDVGIFFVAGCLPAVFISYIIAAFKGFEDCMNYAKGYAWPNPEPIMEVKWYRAAKKHLKEELDLIKKMPIKEIILYIVARISGLAFCILGIWLMMNMDLWVFAFIVGLILFVGGLMIFLVSRALQYEKYIKKKSKKV